MVQFFFINFKIRFLISINLNDYQFFFLFERISTFSRWIKLNFRSRFIVNEIWMFLTNCYATIVISLLFFFTLSFKVEKSFRNHLFANYQFRKTKFCWSDNFHFFFIDRNFKNQIYLQMILIITYLANLFLFKYSNILISRRFLFFIYEFIIWTKEQKNLRKESSMMIHHLFIIWKYDFSFLLQTQFFIDIRYSLI